MYKFEETYVDNKHRFDLEFDWIETNLNTR